VVSVNEGRRMRMAEKIVEACDGSVQGKTIAILGLTFKPNTDDMRDSPSLDIVPELIRRGAAVRAFDPQGMKEAKKFFNGHAIEWCNDAYAAMSNADALAILTEWNEFRALDLKRVKSLLKAPILIDLRNIYKPQEMLAAGLRYVSVGRPVIQGTAKL
jgi:UDPglucose 6-dehydrogenase